MNLLDVVRELGTEDECFAFLEQMRWPGGVVSCAVCGCERISRIERKSASKNVRRNIYQCLKAECGQQFSVTSGTIFHDTRIPLTKWFLAIQLIMESKKGMSAMQLKRTLWGDHKGSYQTAWHMCHRIREAMASGSLTTQLTGIVEVDEVMTGGKQKGKPGRSKSKNKGIVLGLRQRGGPLKLVPIPDCKAATIRKVAEEHIGADVEKIITDEWKSYPSALRSFKGKHKTINHSKGNFVTGRDGEIHTNTVESPFSLLKRGIIGSYHKISVKHLARYASEFEYRFNQRDAGSRFEDMVKRTGKTGPLPYRKLVEDLIPF